MDGTANHISALTIDVEDGLSIAMRDYFNIEMDPTKRVVSNVDVILDICARNDVRGTFFILAEVAEKFPEMVKKISGEGHELGIHGYHHDQIFKLTPELLGKELTRAKKLVEDLSGQEILGFRAPAFSINQQTLWALPVIAGCGFKYDSSIFPSLLLRYGWKGFSKEICKLKLDHSASLIEVPLSVIRRFGRDLPVGGGGYLRYLPYYWTRKAIQEIIQKRPALVYLHPYELDTEKYPEYFYRAMAAAPSKQKLSLLFYRFKKNTVKTKLYNLTKEFSFMPLKNIIRDLEERGLIPEIIL